MIEDIFGEKLPNQQYRDRRGVYAIILNEKMRLRRSNFHMGMFYQGEGLKVMKQKLNVFVVNA